MFKHLRLALRHCVFILCVPFGLIGKTERISLNGDWKFGLDPLDLGETQEWYRPGLMGEKWDDVAVPHCFSTDPRYHYFTGSAWYTKAFAGRSLPAGTRAFVRFEAAFYQATVWLNGRRVGEHEGGYTPFELDVTQLLSDKENTLCLRVNNRWGTDTIPGAKTVVDYQSANMRQLFPWINYGGITRAVTLLVRPEVHVQNVKIDTVPDLETGMAEVGVRVFVNNLSSATWSAKNLGITLRRDGRVVPAEFVCESVSVAAGSRGVVRACATVAKSDVALWSFDSPSLYEAVIATEADEAVVPFGIRKIEVRGTKLLLNGEPLSLGGCNRPLDSPGNGSMDPPEVLEKDLRMIKSAGMELSRMSHYPVSRELLDWADRHGLLIIGESGNWQMTAAQMSDPAVRAKYQAQMREMMENDWNHPSVIGWSVGNEFASETEEGRAWTRDMYAFVKSLDDTRPVTFASNRVFRPAIKSAEEEASRYVDFISANIYGGHLASLRRIHELYPDKPVFISEFGTRADKAPDEEHGRSYILGLVQDLRQCDYVAGASVWTFNDYQSMFPGTNPNGYRPYGVVRPDRTPRVMYHAFQEEFAPAVLAARRIAPDQLEVMVTARKDFPSYTLRNYRLRADGEIHELPVLKPGESAAVMLRTGVDQSEKTMVELMKPGGFTILRRSF